MTKDKLTDKQAKKILMWWPARTRSLWYTPREREFWLRALPKAKDAATVHPRLRAPGSSHFTTQPDGMWAYLGVDYADVVCIEVCGSPQNLSDKRSRYAPSTHSVIMDCPYDWLHEPATPGGSTARWKACGSVKKEPDDDIALPVRSLRVLYALPGELYARWSSNLAPAGHEYFCKHSSLRGYNGQQMQDFLRQMSATAHFLTTVGKQ